MNALQTTPEVVRVHPRLSPPPCLGAASLVVPLPVGRGEMPGSTSSRQNEQTPGANRAKESKRKKGHVCCRRTVRGVGASVMLFSCRKIYRTTLGNGYLGSRIDEERSEMRYLV